MNIRFPLCLTRKGPGYYLNDATGRTVAAMTADKEDAEFILLACNRHHDLLAANQMRIHVFVDRTEKGKVRCPRLISADVPEDTTADDFRSRITAAVSQWAKTDDEEARRMIESACDDLNVGDLASCDLDSGAFADCLAEQDVRKPQLHAPQPAAAAEAGTDELIAWAQTLGLSPEDMDDVIHDQVETLGSRLNNEGLSAQIEFLVGQLGVEEARSLMAELVTVKTP